MPNDQPETIAAILAKYRKDIAGGQFFTPTQEYILRLLDRIEAAAERERNAHTNDIHDALYMATGIPGNAAAMREALEYAERWLHGMLQFCDRRTRGEEIRVPALSAFGTVDRISAALAAPARNCDRFKTAVEAMEEWNKYPQSRYKGCRVCPHGNASMVSPAHLTLAEWLFAPAKGGDHA